MIGAVTWSPGAIAAIVTRALAGFVLITTVPAVKVFAGTVAELVKIASEIAPPASVATVRMAARPRRMRLRFRFVSTEPFHATLRYDEGRAAAWRRSENSAMPPANETAAPLAGQLAYLLYFFHWEPSRTTVLRARAHRPDTCLPNAGWKQARDLGTRSYPAAEIRLPFRHLEFVRRPESPAAQYANAFYCIREDRIRVEPSDTGEATRENGKSALIMGSDFYRPVFEGERERGLQVMQAVLVSAQPLDPEMAEAQFAELVRTVIITAPAERAGGP